MSDKEKALILRARCEVLDSAIEYLSRMAYQSPGDKILNSEYRRISKRLRNQYFKVLDNLKNLELGESCEK